MTRLFLFGFALSAASGAFLSATLEAQTAPRGPAAIAGSLQKSWNDAKRNVAESAELMPEANYSYKPIETVRTFGQILAHLAGANYVFCAAARSEKPPFGEGDFEKTATTRAAITKALADSHSYCDAVFSGLTDARLAEIVTAPFTNAKENRAQVLMGQIGHVNEHYGNLVTYFRMKGLVPPSSRR